MATQRRFESSSSTAPIEASLVWILTVMLLAGCGAGAGSGNGGNSISVAITNKVTSIQAGTAAIVFTATVQNDSSNSGVTWSLTANATPCSPACGSLSQASSTTVTYTPSSSAPAAPINQPTLTATSVAKTNKSDSDVFTITPSVIVTIANKFAFVNSGASPFVVNATVQNDSTNGGVSWTLTANGTACSPSCGSLSGITASSVTYSPPASPPASQLTITAISVHDSSKSDSDGFTIQQPAIVVAIQGKITSAPAGNPGIFVAARVENDPFNAGTTWKLTANGANCTASTCGTLSAAGQESIVYNPPASVPAPPFNKPTLTAISITDPTKSDSDTFTITSAPPISVTVTQVGSVLAGSTGGVNFSANVQNDFSNPPKGVTWTLTVGGSVCSGCGTLSNFTPTSVTYTPPPSAPSSPNNQPTVTATSVADNTKSGSDTFMIISSLTSACGSPTGNEGLLTGHYALLIEGFEGSGAGIPLFIAASFNANGSGGFTGGVNGVAQDIGEEDTNDTISPQHLTLASSGSFYTVGSDHRGCLQLTNTGGTTAVFHFAVGGIKSGIASKGRIIEFDDSSGAATGNRGSGILRLQDPNAFVLSALQAQYAFGIDGWATQDDQYFRINAAGMFANSGGVLNGIDDLNFAGITTPDGTGLTGSINPISAITGRATGKFDIFDWAIYVVTSSEFFVVGTDPVNNGNVSVGRAIATGNSFAASSLSGNNVVHSSGNANGKASVDLELLTMTPGGGQTGTLSGTVYSDGGGNGLQTTTLSSVSYNVDPSSGRVVLGNPGDNLPILYLTTPTDGISGFLVGLGADAPMGLLEFQPSQTYSTASAAGTYFFGTEDPGDNTVYDEVGAATISTSGSATGTVDSSSASGLAPGVPFNATLTLNSSGVGSLSSISSIAITNGTKIFYIDETAGIIVEAEQ